MMTMATEWAHFESADIAPDAPEVQRMEMRKAFYAGLSSGIKLSLQRTAFENVAEMHEYIAAEDSRRRLARIELLMRGDPEPGSVAGKELTALVDQQMEAESHISFVQAKAT